MAQDNSVPPIITKELQDTLRNNPHIDKVYFDSFGNHHFHCFQVMRNPKGDPKDVVNCWQGIYSHSEKIKDIPTDVSAKEQIAYADPVRTITSTMTRAAVLEKVVVDKNNSLVEIAKTKSPGEILEFMNYLQSIAKSTPPPAAATPPAVEYKPATVK